MTAEAHRSQSPLGTVAGAFRILFTQVHLRAMFFAIIAYGASFGAAVPFIPIWLSESFGSSEFEIGVLIMFRGLGGAIGIPLIGWYADRTGRRRPSIIGSFAVVMVSYLGMVLAPSYEIALAMAVLSGMSAVALCFVLVEEILERLPAAQDVYRTTVSAYERTAFNVGGAFGTMLGAAAVGFSGSIIAGLLIAGVFSAIGILAMLHWPSLPAASPSSAAGMQMSAASPNSLPKVAPLLWLSFGLFFLSQLLLFTMSWARSIFIPLYIVNVLGEAPGLVGPIFAVETVTVIIIGPFAGLWIDRWGVRVALVGNMAFVAIGIAMVPFAGEYWQLLIIGLTFGIGQGLGGVAAILYATQLLPGRAGLGVSLYTSSFHLAPIIAGLGLGALAEQASLTTAFLAAGAIGVLATAAMIASDMVAAPFRRVLPNRVAKSGTPPEPSSTSPPR